MDIPSDQCQFNFGLSVSKFLITNGQNHGGTTTGTEIMDLTIKGNSECKNWADFPKDIFGAVGGFVGNEVIICGGYDQNYSPTDECYSFNEQSAKVVTHTSITRAGAASIVFGNKLWITGGKTKIGK